MQAAGVSPKAEPMDPTLHAKYLHVLSLWDVTNYITWEDTALRFVQKELEGYTPRLIGKLMYEHVRDGGAGSGEGGVR